MKRSSSERKRIAKIKAAQRRLWASPEAYQLRRLCSEEMRRRWADPEIRARMIKGRHGRQA